MMSLSNLRKNRFVLVLLFILSVLAYIFIKQKQTENRRLVERMESVKNTIPPSLYSNIRKLKEKLYTLEFNNNARTQELLSLQRKLQTRLGENVTNEGYLSLPSIYNYLPHLLGHKDALVPLVHHPVKERKTRTLTFGIPTVRRTKKSYLLKTLQSLVHGLSAEERDDVILIVYIGEKNSEYVREIYTEIKSQFPAELDDGFIEVISPPSNFYPDLDNLPPTFNDPIERVRWRAKQNLDYAFLMMYAQSRSMFYVQMEDDLMATPSYASTIKAFAIQQQSNNWLMIEFSSLGFIGKLFKSSDLSTLVEFFLMFYKEKPNDWLLDHIFWVKVCHPEKNAKHCNKEKSKLRIKFKPSLFQHIGKESSLKGKTQKLVDKEFKKQALFHSHLNPKATIKTDLEEYQKFTAERAYLGHTYMWALSPVKNAVLRMVFEQPEHIERFYFKSGNVEHPGDKLVNGTVEVLKSATKKSKFLIEDPTDKRGPYKDSDYVIVGKFDFMGVASGVISPSLLPISEMRIRVTHDVAKNWVILSEFNLVKQKKTKR
ncbi:alpha-1,3-mannosyl-glycoprotein 4-beta-N-acetylglucosaminyltransferase A-like [Clytia hemisphaerica]|uniref:Uncharacterized protein n=1 Tax=Clytia hemisphaerica TaxID=252671 RepID=A0A7M5TS53_9CNID